jgi:acetate CoA/acetoacetate CoA-transferase beta subunit
VDYKPNKEIIARRIGAMFTGGEVVNLGIGLPTLVGNFVTPGVDIILQSENGFLGLGPRPAPGEEDSLLVNAGAEPVSILPGGSFFDSATSFAIIRGGHVDCTVLGVLEVDQEGNLANYKIPGKLVPGMGGAMDLTVGAKTVIAATLHFNKDGSSKLRARCGLPLTAAGEVTYVVTDLGFFEIGDREFVLKETFPGYSVDYILEHTRAKVRVAEDCSEWSPA